MANRIEDYEKGECATWDCKGALIEDGKLNLKCEKCGRTYWKDEVLEKKGVDEE